jgi:hypothetical protein
VIDIYISVEVENLLSIQYTYPFTHSFINLPNKLQSMNPQVQSINRFPGIESGPSMFLSTPFVHINMFSTPSLHQPAHPHYIHSLGHQHQRIINPNRHQMSPHDI